MSSSSSIGPYHPSQPEEIIPPLAKSISDPSPEQPTSDQILPPHIRQTRQGLSLPPVVLGCATFGYGIYADKPDVLGDIPYRVVRYALRCGINAFDTAPWYHPSEMILGRVLKALEGEFPRDSYQIITKVGKYGPNASQVVYDAESVEASVERSLKRLGTDYLDVVYLHDVEFVASHPCPGGSHLSALSALYPNTNTQTDARISITNPNPESLDPFRIAPPYTPLGRGDEQVLVGLTSLRKLQRQGKIRSIGIAGYPLPTLLRLSLLAADTPSIGSLDIIQTYAHQTILNPSLEHGYLAAFINAGVGRVMNAAPLAMGILTTRGGPSWHPANSADDNGAMIRACKEASDLCMKRGTTLEDVSASFGFRDLRVDNGQFAPVVIGCKNVEEVRRTIKVWREVNVPGTITPDEVDKMRSVEDEVGDLFQEKGVKFVSWPSPTQDAF